MFNLVIGLQQIPENKGVIIRKAVRCVAFDSEGKLLMIRTNRGDYKFPGGGMEVTETLEQTLAREILEETGFSLLRIKDIIGIVEERNIDKFDNNKIFVMHSEYAACEVDITIQNIQKLDEYEKEQDFKVEFVSIKDAIDTNIALMKKSGDINSWVQRETEILKQLLK